MAQTEHPRMYWETSRVILGHQYRAWRGERVHWVPGRKHAGSSEGNPQGGGRVDFALWGYQRSGFGEGGNADLFIQGPPDGAHKDVWREYGFGDGGNADLFIQGPPDGAHKDGWREYGFRCGGFAGGMDT